MTELSCFKAYDIRGEINVNINEDVAYRVGRAVATHFNTKSIVVGFDARETSPAFAAAASCGVQDAGSDVLNIGLAGTEEMYWAVSEFCACAGIEVTASHNPINYNGMKIVKSGSKPLHDLNDFQVIKSLASSCNWTASADFGKIHDLGAKARAKYIERILSFVDPPSLMPLKIVINSGNGAAGPTLNAVISRLKEQGALVKFIPVQNEPDSSFPHGIPNPLLSENHAATAEVVVRESADFGVAFDGDFDRCFFFDGKGHFVASEYVVGLIGASFLEKEKGCMIVHDPRVIWNTRDIVFSKGGIPIQSKTGHAFMKQTMRDNEAVYGGEVSAHHYFRDFAYCDSGMIPWLLVAELVSKTGRSLSELVQERIQEFPSSGEINFRVENASKALKRVLEVYRADALSLDETDGVSIAFDTWRFNLRVSNTEPLVRLNIEGRGEAVAIDAKVKEVSKLLDGTKI